MVVGAAIGDGTGMVPRGVKKSMRKGSFFSRVLVVGSSVVRSSNRQLFTHRIAHAVHDSRKEENERTFFPAHDSSPHLPMLGPRPILPSPKRTKFEQIHPHSSSTRSTLIHRNNQFVTSLVVAVSIEFVIRTMKIRIVGEEIGFSSSSVLRSG